MVKISTDMTGYAPAGKQARAHSFAMDLTHAEAYQFISIP
jgi:hypothetical protein